MATFTGNNESNVITGSAGQDLIYGLGGNDVLYGNAGNDIIYGGDGIDQLHGGSGNDSLFGGNGNDTFVFNAPAASGLSETDFVLGFTDGDILQYTGAAQGVIQSMTTGRGGAVTIEWNVGGGNMQTIVVSSPSMPVLDQLDFSGWAFASGIWG